MFEHYYAVIMAGGGGTRLWPLSRQTKPKQMLPLFGSRTLFEMAIDRLDGVTPPDHIYVVTVVEQADSLMALRPEIPAENYLIEPMPRGTASVVGLAAVALLDRDPQSIIAVLTADQFIKDETAFRELLRNGYSVAEAGWLVTLGITPTYPSTGYGYIQRGEPLQGFDQFPTYRVQRFKEKPDESQARAMLANGDHVWNSGMFIWKSSRILQEFQRFMPDLHAGLLKIATAWDTASREDVIRAVWPELKSETIDYGIMEHAQDVAVLPAVGLGWNDVGSWQSLFDVLPRDSSGNIILNADHQGIETRDTLVHGSSSKRLIVTIGVNDLVIIDTGDTLLVCHKDQSQKVRQIVNQLKADGRNEYL